MTSDALSAGWGRLYLLVWLGCALVVAWVTPPFMAPDEPAHMMRAYQLSQGVLVGHAVGTGSGGTVDSEMGRVFEAFRPYMALDAPPVPASHFETAHGIAWSASPWEADFRNTVQYGPFFYLPQAAALWVGRHAHLSILDSYYLARAAALLASFGIIVAALHLGGRIKPLQRVILLLPMTLFLCVSVSQDGPMIATALLLAAILSRPLTTGQPLGAALYLIAALCVAALGLARLPYAALAGLFLLPSLRGRRTVAALLFVVLLVAGWIWASAPVRGAPGYSGADRVTGAAAQLHWMIGNPLAAGKVLLVTITSRSFMQFYLESFIGNLGWLTISLAPWAYRAAEAALIAAAAACCFGPGRSRWSEAGLAAVVLSAAVIGIFLGLYLVWSAVGAPVVDGVQGRYFLPLAGFLPFLLPILAPARRAAGALAVLALLLMLPVLADMMILLHRHYVLGS